MSKTQEQIQADATAPANAETQAPVIPQALKAEPVATTPDEESGFGPLEVAKIKMVKPPFQFKADHKKCPSKWAQVIITDNNVEIFEFATHLKELSDSAQATHCAYKKSLSSGKPFFEGFTQERLTVSETAIAKAEASTILLQKMQELGMTNAINFG